jgi:hypothetical protein
MFAVNCDHASAEISFAHSAVAAAAAADSSGACRRRKLKLGTQHGDTDDILRVMAAFGVNYICGQLSSAKFDENWSVDAVKCRREHVESFGITLEAVPCRSVPLTSRAARTLTSCWQEPGTRPAKSTISAR